MEFSGIIDGVDKGENFDSKYWRAQKESKLSDLQWSKIFNQKFTVEYVDPNSKEVRQKDTISLTMSGIATATHLLGEGTMGRILNELYSSCFNADGSPKLDANNKPITTVQLDSTGNYADGSGIAFSTYIKHSENFDISNLVGDGNKRPNYQSEFNGFVEALIRQRTQGVQSNEHNMIKWLEKQDADVKLNIIENAGTAVYSINYRDIIKSVIKGFGCAEEIAALVDKTDKVDGAVVFSGKNIGHYNTEKADIIFGVKSKGVTLDGGKGNDYIYSAKNTTASKIYGGEGNDNISVWGNENKIYGGNTPNDNYAVDDNIINVTGDSNYIYGGAGFDTYYFARGWGRDIIDNADTDPNGPKDIIAFASGISARDIEIGRTLTDLRLKLKGTSDVIIIENFFAANAVDLNADKQIGQIQFADGTLWTAEYILSQLGKVVAGSWQDDRLGGTSGADFIYGMAGNDYLYGQAGDDYLYGGAGQDTLYGGDGADWLEGGAGNDTLYGENGADTILFGPGISPSDIVVRADLHYSDTLKLLYKSGNSYASSISINGFFYTHHMKGPIGQVQFADGTVWNRDKILSFLPSLRQGTAGNDVLVGGSGGDVLTGGKGNDILFGGEGSDTYYFEKGWGDDIIYNEDNSSGKKDAIKFGAGITSKDIVLQMGMNRELILTRKGSKDKITVSDYFNIDSPNFNYLIDEIRFANGTVWNEQYIRNQLSCKTTSGDDGLYGTRGNDEIHGLAGNDTLYGGAGNDKLYGDQGNDELYGGYGDDLLVGGAGNDTLYGGSGNDVYYFEKGWGQDVVDNRYQNDNPYQNSILGGDPENSVIRFGAGIAAASMIAARSGGDLKLSILGSTDTITVKDYFANEKTRIREIQFADGARWDASTIAQKVAAPQQASSAAMYSVDALVSAMAAFAPPAAGESTLMAIQRQQPFMPMLAAS